MNVASSCASRQPSASSLAVPLYVRASDLAYCGYTAPAVMLLREAIRRNYCASAAIDIDPMFASIHHHAEYAELLSAARACRERFGLHVRTTVHPS